MSKEDLIVWFDTQTGEAMPEKSKTQFIKEVGQVAQKYDFDFNMCFSPKGMKNFIDRLALDGYFEEEESDEND